MIDLLSRRMRAQGIDTEEIARCEPAILGSLRGVCASCEYREECELGLADDFADVAWDAYCPNAASVNALGELPWFELPPAAVPIIGCSTDRAPVMPKRSQPLR